MTSTTPYSTLSALSPLDGRYASKTDLLRPILSEAGFMHHRVKVVSWLQALSQPVSPKSSLSRQKRAPCSTRWRPTPEADAARIKAIEAVTNHDVKAVEYWLKEQVADVYRNWWRRRNSSILPAPRKTSTTPRTA